MRGRQWRPRSRSALALRPSLSASHRAQGAARFNRVGAKAAIGHTASHAEALTRHQTERIDICRVFGLVYDSLRERPQLRQMPWFGAALGGSEYVLRAN